MVNSNATKLTHFRCALAGWTFTQSGVTIKLPKEAGHEDGEEVVASVSRVASFLYSFARPSSSR